MTDREMAIYDILVELEIATEDEISLVRYVMSGYWEEILNAIIYARTGYHDIEQLIECELSQVFGEDYGNELLERLNIA